MGQMAVTKTVRVCYALELKQNKAGLHSTQAYVGPMQSEKARHATLLRQASS